MNFRSVLYIIGLLISTLGCMMIIPALFDLFSNHKNWSIFASTGIISFLMGITIILAFKNKNTKIGSRETFLLSVLSWIFLASISALPLYLSNLSLSYTDAFFEATSGITTTGSTILTNIENASNGILIWRAILQWLGGIGIILMAITLMPIMNVGGMQLFKISSNDNSEKILPKSKEIALTLILIYFGLTILCSFFYKIFGMNYFDSLTHSMTTIATGGFSNYNESIGYFDNANIEITAIIFIILGSLPFIAYIKFLNGDKKIFISDAQIKLFIKIILFSILILFIYLTIINKSFFEVSLRSISFNVISILTGTGYVTKGFDNWGSFPLIFFVILMFIGGCAGSTACGIKIFRIKILYLFLINQLKKIIYPRGIFIIKYEENTIDNKFIASIISFVYLYIIIFFTITALLSLSGLDFITSISGAATSISNVGPGLGTTIGPSGNFSSLPDFSKWILSLGMILGRLELFAILVLFLPSFWIK